MWLSTGNNKKLYDNIIKFDDNLHISDLETIYNYVLYRELGSNKLSDDIEILLNMVDLRFERSTMLNINAGNVYLELGNIEKAELYLDKIIFNPDVCDDDIVFQCLQYYKIYGYLDKTKQIINVL